MDQLRKFWRLRWSEQVVLVCAGFLLIAAEAGLRILPFGKLVTWVQKRAAKKRNSSQPSPDRIAYLVEVAARYLSLLGSFGGWLQPTCLRKSIALCVLLGRRGWDARLVLGTGSLDGVFQAHAWVEVEGKRLGRGDASTYHELAGFAGNQVGRQIA